MKLHLQSRTDVYTAGFTLLELMITVAIIAILATIALPSYSVYITRSKLTDAHNGLADFRVRMEQYFQDNRTYLKGAACGATAPGLTYFDFACTVAGTAPDQTYKATASGKSGTPVEGFTFQIDQANNRSTTAVPAGWGTAPVACGWVVRKGGGCS